MSSTVSMCRTSVAWFKLSGISFQHSGSHNRVYIRTQLCCLYVLDKLWILALLSMQLVLTFTMRQWFILRKHHWQLSWRAPQLVELSVLCVNREFSLGTVLLHLYVSVSIGFRSNFLKQHNSVVHCDCGLRIDTDVSTSVYRCFGCVDGLCPT